MNHRQLGSTSLRVSPIGYGAFKIGRNQKVKYPTPYDLPEEAAVQTLLNSILDLGVNVIDTAPAYGLSEERIGSSIGHRREEFVLSSKVGETFADGESTYDFRAQAVRESVRRSLNRLKTDVLDVVYIHSNGDDLKILRETDTVAALEDLKRQGDIRHIGMSGKTIEGAREALAWADVIMVEYHLGDESHAEVMHQAAAKGVGVVVKKGLAAGHLPPADGVRFVLSHPAVSSMVIGGLNVDHIRANMQSAMELES